MRKNYDFGDTTDNRQSSTCLKWSGWEHYETKTTRVRSRKADLYLNDWDIRKGKCLWCIDKLLFLALASLGRKVESKDCQNALWSPADIFCHS